MNDPLEPFRAEFKARLYPFGYYSWAIHGHREVMRYVEQQRNARGGVNRWIADQLEPLYRAAKALQIAETLGPDQALLWKLSN